MVSIFMSLETRPWIFTDRRSSYSSPLPPSYSNGSLTVTDALGISPGVLLSFGAKISGKKSIPPRKKEGRKEGRRRRKNRKRLLLSMLTSVSVSWNFLLPFIYLFIYFLFQYLREKILPLLSNRWDFERKNRHEREREKTELSQRATINQMIFRVENSPR